MMRLTKILHSAKNEIINVIDTVDKVKSLSIEIEKCKEEIEELKKNNCNLEKALKEKSDAISKDMGIMVTVLKNLFFNVDEITRAFQTSEDVYYHFDEVDPEDEEGH